MQRVVSADKHGVVDKYERYQGSPLKLNSRTFGSARVLRSRSPPGDPAKVVRYGWTPWTDGSLGPLQIASAQKVASASPTQVPLRFPELSDTLVALQSILADEEGIRVQIRPRGSPSD